MKKNRYITYMPELDLSHFQAGHYAPAVVYNPVKLKTIHDNIPPSASIMLIIGLKDWDAPNRFMEFF